MNAWALLDTRKLATGCADILVWVAVSVGVCVWWVWHLSTIAVVVHVGQSESERQTPSWLVFVSLDFGVVSRSGFQASQARKNKYFRYLFYVEQFPDRVRKLLTIFYFNSANWASRLCVSANSLHFEFICSEVRMELLHFKRSLPSEFLGI